MATHDTPQIPLLCALCGLTLSFFLFIFLFIPASPAPGSVTGMATSSIQQNLVDQHGIYLIEQIEQNTKIVAYGRYLVGYTNSDGEYETTKADFNGEVAYIPGKNLYLLLLS